MHEWYYHKSHTDTLGYTHCYQVRILSLCYSTEYIARWNYHKLSTTTTESHTTTSHVQTFSGSHEQTFSGQVIVPDAE